MDRCDYCGRILHINRSDKYFLCSKKCKQKFKNKSDILNTNKFVLNLVSKEWISVNDIVYQIQINLKLSHQSPD